MASSSYALTCWTSPRISGPSGASGSGCAPSRSIRAGISTTAVGGQVGQCPVVLDVDDLDVAARRRAAMRSAGRRPRCRRRRRGARAAPASGQRLGRDTDRAGRASMSMTSWARVWPPRWSATTCARLVVVAQVVGRDRRRRSGSMLDRQARPRLASPSASVAISSGSRSTPSTRTAALPAQVVEPDVLELDPVRRRRRNARRDRAGS